MGKIKKAHTILVTESSREQTARYTYKDWGIKVNLTMVIV
jgi:hypothetical protein